MKITLYLNVPRSRLDLGKSTWPKDAEIKALLQHRYSGYSSNRLGHYTPVSWDNWSVAEQELDEVLTKMLGQASIWHDFFWSFSVIISTVAKGQEDQPGQNSHYPGIGYNLKANIGEITLNTRISELECNWVLEFREGYEKGILEFQRRLPVFLQQCKTQIILLQGISLAQGTIAKLHQAFEAATFVF